MCVIVYKPTGSSMPTTLEKCFNANPHGAGYMLPYNGAVVIRKGFMTYNDFINDLNGFITENNINVETTPIAFHFRITTQGGVQKELTHPFSVCDSYDNMRKLENTCDLAMMHNGIIRLTSVYGGAKVNYNDSMTFIKNYANLIIDNDIYFNRNRKKIQLIYNLIGNNNKLLFMNKNGYATLIGAFFKEGGVYYSNMYWHIEKIDLNIL